MPYASREKRLAIGRLREKDRRARGEANKHAERCNELKRLAKNTGCVICGENSPVCLDFHHINPDTKSFNIGNNRVRNIEALVVEIAKCVVLCANCHRKLHAGLVTLDPR